MNAMRCFYVILLLLTFGIKNYAQSGIAENPHVFIDSITIEGNRKTRTVLILRELEFAPGLAAGLTTWTSGEPPFDIAGKGSGNYLVGSPETVAALMNQLSDKLDIDTWILSGWPLAAEAERFATQVMPLLDVAPYEPPVLRG